MKQHISSVVLAKKSHLLLTAFFLLSFLCVTNAQALQPPSQTFNWKSGEETVTILMNQITVLNQQMPGIQEGTPLYDNTVRRIAYFKAIVEEVRKGTDVAQSLELAIPAAATLGFEKEASYTPKVILRALQTETRVLVTN